MISETDIVNGYMWLLGRLPSAGEIVANRQYYEAATGDVMQDFKRSLMTSAEFRQQRLHCHKLDRSTPTELHRQRLVFLHIEKCGGTTLQAMLAAHFDADRICPERHDGLGDWTVNELAGYDFFSGHFDLVCCRSIPGSLRFVTMLRQPKDRLLSLYRFWKSHRPHPTRDQYNLVTLARACSVEAFFAHPTVAAHTAIRNAMTGQLIRSRNKMLLDDGDLIVSDPATALEQAWSRLSEFAGVGILERFDESRQLLGQALGLQMRPIAPLQVLADLVRTHPELQPVELEPLTKRLDALLTPLTDIDQVLYDRAVALFEARLESSRGGADAPAARRPSPRSLMGQVVSIVRRAAG